MAKPFLELCKQYFDSDNFYEILKIDKLASDKDVKKAYHRLSLLVHPDRVNENQKDEATEKFKVLGRIHAILSDVKKRAAYDEAGVIDDDDSGLDMQDWYEYWRSLFKEITIDSISNYEKQYKGSEEETRDLKKAYIAGKGDFNLIHEMVPFSKLADEPRFIDIMKEVIEKEDLPYYKLFFEEPPAKKKRRERKYAKEAEQAKRLEMQAELRAKIDGKKKDSRSDLEALLLDQARNREKSSMNFFEALEAKYAEPARKKRKTTAGDEPPKKNAGTSRTRKCKA